MFCIILLYTRFKMFLLDFTMSQPQLLDNIKKDAHIHRNKHLFRVLLIFSQL